MAPRWRVWVRRHGEEGNGRPPSVWGTWVKQRKCDRRSPPRAAIAPVLWSARAFILVIHYVCMYSLVRAFALLFGLRPSMGHWPCAKKGAALHYGGKSPMKSLPGPLLAPGVFASIRQMKPLTVPPPKPETSWPI